MTEGLEEAIRVLKDALASHKEHRGRYCCADTLEAAIKLIRARADDEITGQMHVCPTVREIP